MKTTHIIGGGTVYHVRNHLALCAPAYGNTAKRLHTLCSNNDFDHKIELHLTKMAGGLKLETNKDISELVDRLISDPDTHIIYFNPALVDFGGTIMEPGPVGYEWGDSPTPSGKYEERLKTADGNQLMELVPFPKIINKIRKERKDIFLVGFKTTCGATEDQQFLTGLHLLKSSSCNLIVANDTKTHLNMIITPEQARYAVTHDREHLLFNLVRMTNSRSKGRFTRSRVVTGRGIPWQSDTVPTSLRTVVDHCIAQGAYKPFKGKTVGHFAAKMDEKKFMTSLRGTNFNRMEELAYVHADSDDTVISQGGKSSVGGQSQRIIFREHPEMDCIVHFHCPPKPEAQLSVRGQFNYECGSHQCGQNTSDGLKEAAPGIKCVYLDNHGPNIVFNRSIDPQKVIDFIDTNFDLSKSTDGVDRSQNQVS